MENCKIKKVWRNAFYKKFFLRNVRSYVKTQEHNMFKTIWIGAKTFKPVFEGLSTQTFF
jgi:hypothetical protein